MPFRVTGPKGHLVVRSAPLARLAKKLPQLVKRFGRVNVSAAPAAPPAATTPPSAAAVRARVVEFCRWGIANESKIHYAQTRPMERLHSPAQLHTLPREADCSEWATDAYAYAGGPDPNGEHFNGTGYTGTLLSHCRHIPQGEAKAGDLVVFGAAPGHHVVVLMQRGGANGGDPLVCSHGQEKGPIAIRLSDEARAQPRPLTFLTCLD